jgi:glycosyltransferase involved in cell wall biosynthesis
VTEPREALDRPLRILGFVERYLQPDQTFIYRQMSALEGCGVRMCARHHVAGNPYTDQGVAYVGRRSQSPWPRPAQRAARLGKRLLGRYALLGPLERLRLKRVIGSFRPDLVHAHWAPDAMLVAPLCARLGIPLLVHFHGHDASRLGADPLYRRQLHFLFRQMAGALTVSEHQRGAVLTLGCPPANVGCHYTGVPDEYFGPARERQAGARASWLQVGRLAPKKGVEVSLRAFASVARGREDAVLRIVGDGPLRPDVVRLVAELGLGPKVELLGHQAPPQVIVEMRRADALLVPSHTAADGDTEGLPNVAVEGMAAGLPIIATRHGGIPEAVRYSIPDWLVAERDVAGLADRMRRLATDDGLWRRLSEEGRAIARERFHLPTQNRRLVEIYRRLIVRGHLGE